MKTLVCPESIPIVSVDSYPIVLLAVAEEVTPCGSWTRGPPADGIPAVAGAGGSAASGKRTARIVIELIGAVGFWRVHEARCWGTRAHVTHRSCQGHSPSQAGPLDRATGHGSTSTLAITTTRHTWWCSAYGCSSSATIMAAPPGDAHADVPDVSRMFPVWGRHRRWPCWSVYLSGGKSL